MPELSDLLFTWNGAAPAAMADTRIEDDTLREGLQGAFARKPTLAQKKDVLRGIDDVGVDYTLVGFPAISPAEEEECSSLVDVIVQEKRRIKPKALARAHVPDLASIARLCERHPVPTTAEMFLGTSPLRRAVEGWDRARNLEQLAKAASYCATHRVPWGLSLEDATRTPPDDLRIYVAAAIDGGASQLTICDTVGESHPDGAERVAAFVRGILDQRGSRALLLFHGHNDKGLALANSFAAVRGGATCISGSFLGLGERAGNAALEQVVFFLHRAGSALYDVTKLVPLVRFLAEITETRLPATTPLVGDQAFATVAGTHAAAIVKARQLGPDFEDFVFSGVPATALGRRQTVMLGPTSGLTNVRQAVDVLRIDADDDALKALLEHAKTLDRFMTEDQIRAFMGKDRG